MVKKNLEICLENNEYALTEVKNLGKKNVFKMFIVTKVCLGFYQRMITPKIELAVLTALRILQITNTIEIRYCDNYNCVIKRYLPLPRKK